MVAQIVYVVCHTAISQIQVVGLCRIFGSQRINLFNDRYDTYALTVVTDIDDSIFHFSFVTNSTCNLEIGESLTFCLVQQIVWKLRQQLVVVAPFVKFLRSLHDVHQLVEEPLVYLCQFMNLIYGISSTHCLRDNEDTLVGRFTQCLVDIGNLQFFVFYKSVHALTNHTKTFLDSFFECTADSHHFADRLHA